MDWLEGHSELAWWLFAASGATFVGSLITLPFLLAKIPADYFVREPGEASWPGRHPSLRIFLRVLKNLVGVILAAAGLIMLITPGQGILMLLIGLSMLDLPGKRRLELALIRRPHVHQAIDWIRRKAHRPPLILPPREPRSAEPQAADRVDPEKTS